jgi:hypothetical protein
MWTVPHATTTKKRSSKMNDFHANTGTNIGTNTPETNEVVPSKAHGKPLKTTGFITKTAAGLLSKTIAVDLKKAREIVLFEEFVLKEKDNLIELINLGFSVDDIVLKLREGGFNGATKAKVNSILNLTKQK